VEHGGDAQGQPGPDQTSIAAFDVDSDGSRPGERSTRAPTIFSNQPPSVFNEPSDDPPEVTNLGRMAGCLCPLAWLQLPGRG